MDISSPLFKRKILRIIPFGIIWLFVGWMMILIEYIAAGTNNPNPGVTIDLSVPVFLFASVAVVTVGLSVGSIEIFWLERFFRKMSFGRKLFYRFLVYGVFMFFMIVILYPVAASIETGTTPFDPDVWIRLGGYLTSINYLSTLIQMAFSLFLCFFYLGISENVGDKVLVNFFTGKYHSPIEENRIFMFLDMKSSTTIAEELGNIRYFDLLRDYYDELSESIILHKGEVYQYVGDEIVISWNLEAGLENDNCVKCFFSMKEALERNKDVYEKKYNFFPTFKAGLHFGPVTTGEIGALKKEIFYTGDVLNVTSRIQNLCNTYQMDLVISEELAERLSLEGIESKTLGEVSLKGRIAKLGILGIQES